MFNLIIHEDNLLSRCTKCNGNFIPQPLTPEEAVASVADGQSIPEYAIVERLLFWQCSVCMHMYWQVKPWASYFRWIWLHEFIINSYFFLFYSRREINSIEHWKLSKHLHARCKCCSSDSKQRSLSMLADSFVPSSISLVVLEGLEIEIVHISCDLWVHVFRSCILVKVDEADWQLSNDENYEIEVNNRNLVYYVMGTLY
jgi:hypothetical protein